VLGRKALHIHVKRLERVEALLGGDWNAPERSLQLQPALQPDLLTRQKVTDATFNISLPDPNMPLNAT
jgi:hypothetical protein